MEALVSGHPRDMKKGYITGVGCLRECKNTEFVWEIRKMGFCEGGRKKNCLRVFITSLPQTVIPRTVNCISHK